MNADLLQIAVSDDGIATVTMNRPGKRIRQRRRMTYGSRAGTKRAMVTLAEGDEIELFEVR